MKKNGKKKNHCKETSFVLKRFFSSEEAGNAESILFADYFIARKHAKKIIKETAEKNSDILVSAPPDVKHFEEIAPDYWVSSSETITISTIEIDK